MATPNQPPKDASERPNPLALLKNYAADSVGYYRNNPAQLKFELLSGLTVSILKVPESVAFSYVAGVHPLQGLYGSFFLGIITGVIGGRPAMISGCAGALAVVIRIIMSDDGPFGDQCLDRRREYLLFTMIWCGIIQVVAGSLRLATYTKLISQSAFLGFFNALAIVIGMSQLECFHKLKDDAAITDALETHGTAQNCTRVDYGSSSDHEWYGFGDKETWLMIGHILLVMATIHFIPKLPKFKVPSTDFWIKPENIIPPCLVGILLSIALEWGLYRGAFDVQTTIVKDVSPVKGDLPPFHIPDVPWGEWDTYAKCLPVAASLCAIGLVESVLTLQAVDEILDETSALSMKHQECIAQGIGNAVSGLFMAMGGDAMIGQSTVNVLNGARGRLSSISAAVFVIIFVVVASPFIEIVPTAGLAGILFIVVIHCFQWNSLVLILRRRIPMYESITIIGVTFLAVRFNLAIGVGVGLIWESLCRAWIASSTAMVLQDSLEDTAKALEGSPVRIKTYYFRGELYFGNAPDFGALFTPKADPNLVVVDCANARFVDFSALFALNRVGKRYADEDKKVIFLLQAADHAFHERVGTGLIETRDLVFKGELQCEQKFARFVLPKSVQEEFKIRENHLGLISHAEEIEAKAVYQATARPADDSVQNGTHAQEANGPQNGVHQHTITVQSTNGSATTSIAMV